ncbi:MAG: hypothetical protein WB949_10955 [Candidatus Acidiferrales bacterium]
MGVPFSIALLVALALGADVPGLAPFRSAPPTLGNAGSVALAMARADASGAAPAVESSQSSNHSSKTLQPQSRLLLVRFVDGEFARLVQPLPGGKKGFKVPAGKPLDMQRLSDALRLYGTAAGQGDTVQITSIEFRPEQIVLRINGGGKKHFHLRDHLQIGIGGMSTPPPQTQNQSYAQQEIPGATLVLDYGRSVPDMSPDDLKHDLSVLLDFSKQRSATVNWIDTLAPQFQEAIKDQRAIVGMDSEMVLAAMGRPAHKVRERDPAGNDTEDWIYGTPPSRTTFVTFEGNTVIRVKEYN